jgi:hypothetical protein
MVALYMDGRRLVGQMASLLRFDVARDAFSTATLR